VIDRGKRNLLGVLIDAVDYDAACARILDAARDSRAFGASALAVHGVMIGVEDAEYRYRLNHLELVVPDGQPVRWGLNMLHKVKLPDRVYGPELTLRVCRLMAECSLPIYLYGSRPEVLDRLRENLPRKCPGLEIAGAQPSRFRRLSVAEKEEVVQRIVSSGARLLLAGLGCPRQEVFAYEMCQALSMPVLAVGAAFDFHAGTLVQAPRWMGRVGLEWLFRLSREPARLARRYLLLNPIYLMLLSTQLLGLRSFEVTSSGEPPGEVSYG